VSELSLKSDIISHAIFTYKSFHIDSLLHARQFVKADVFPSGPSSTKFKFLFSLRLPASVKSIPYQHPHDSIEAGAYFLG